MGLSTGMSMKNACLRTLVLEEEREESMLFFIKKEYLGIWIIEFHYLQMLFYFLTNY